MDVLLPFAVSGAGPIEFHFAISHEQDPHALDYDKPPVERGDDLVEPGMNVSDRP
jgi:hypothetical protein